MTDLNEMWRELERYQSYAEKHGFGEAWRRMTTERTETAAAGAADAAWLAFAANAADAACMALAEKAAGWEKYAITYIRKAIEWEDPL